MMVLVLIAGLAVETRSLVDAGLVSDARDLIGLGKVYILKQVT